MLEEMEKVGLLIAKIFSRRFQLFIKRFDKEIIAGFGCRKGAAKGGAARKLNHSEIRQAVIDALESKREPRWKGAMSKLTQRTVIDDDAVQQWVKHYYRAGDLTAARKAVVKQTKHSLRTVETASAKIK